MFDCLTEVALTFIPLLLKPVSDVLPKPPPTQHAAPDTSWPPFWPIIDTLAETFPLLQETARPRVLLGY